MSIYVITLMICIDLGNEKFVQLVEGLNKFAHIDCSVF